VWRRRPVPQARVPPLQSRPFYGSSRPPYEARSNPYLLNSPTEQAENLKSTVEHGYNQISILPVRTVINSVASCLPSEPFSSIP